MMRSEETFTLVAVGQIETCEIPGVENAYCHFGTKVGEDWTLLNGLDEGVTQLARRGRGAAPEIVWNYPLDFTWSSASVFGWPKLYFSVYGHDCFGKDVIRGYGFVHVPCCPGRHTLPVHLFKPRSRSGLTSIQAWLQRQPAEFKQSDFVCQDQGREVTTVTTSGVINLMLDVMTKGMSALGYEDGSSAQAPQWAQTLCGLSSNTVRASHAEYIVSDAENVHAPSAL